MMDGLTDIGVDEDSTCNLNTKPLVQHHITDGRANGWMDEWMDRLMDGWTLLALQK